MISMFTQALTLKTTVVKIEIVSKTTGMPVIQEKMMVKTTEPMTVSRLIASLSLVRVFVYTVVRFVF